jgi:hypothetical protein
VNVNDAHVSLGFGDHAALFRRGIVRVDKLDVGAEQLLFVEYRDAPKAIDL